MFTKKPFIFLFNTIQFWVFMMKCHWLKDTPALVNMNTSGLRHNDRWADIKVKPARMTPETDTEREIRSHLRHER